MPVSIKHRKRMLLRTTDTAHDDPPRTLAEFVARSPLPLVIEGPTSRGTFFIRDNRNRVWTKDGWRNGVCAALAKEWFKFMPAWVVAADLIQQIESELSRRPGTKVAAA